jgi:drug/metabolite transporter (DMT)-like permease
MVAALLALASSVCWGLSDFIGGFQSRRHHLIAVMLLSQFVAFVILVVVVLAGAPIEHDTAATAWAAGVGVLGLLGLVAFYQALAIGTMSIVAPISATGVAIPVLVGLFSGERPGALQVAGMVLASCGVVLAARASPTSDDEARRTGRTAVGLALVGAIGFGSFFAGIDRAEQTGDVAWVLLAARSADMVALLLVAAVVRPRIPAGAATLAAMAAIGIFDLLANFLFVVATGRGLLSVVGVLGSLYPAFTVVLARFVLNERLSRTQGGGVLLTLTGVAALAAG